VLRFQGVNRRIINQDGVEIGESKSPDFKTNGGGREDIEK